MRLEEIKVNLEEMKIFRRRNAEDRLRFIDFWVDYMKKKDDKVWSQQQAALIDAQFKH